MQRKIHAHGIEGEYEPAILGLVQKPGIEERVRVLPCTALTLR